jgi:hypothetical protein
MRRPLTVLVLAGSLATATIATPTQALAYWRAGVGGSVASRWVRSLGPR